MMNGQDAKKKEKKKKKQKKKKRMKEKQQKKKKLTSCVSEMKSFRTKFHTNVLA